MPQERGKVQLVWAFVGKAYIISRVFHFQMLPAADESRFDPQRARIALIRRAFP